MKVAITALGKDLNSEIDPRFGRAENFIVVDTDTMEFELIENTGVNAMHGAGIQSGQLMNEKNVIGIITGQVGPNAFQTLQAANIKIYQAKGKIADAVEDFKQGKLKQITEMGPAHFGMGGKGRGRGQN